MSKRTPLNLLLSQYDTSYEHLGKILEGLSDTEYLWEPSQPCWSIRKNSENKTSDAFGSAGSNVGWVLEFEEQQATSSMGCAP